MKHVLITGGTDGIGKATARKLVQNNYKVTILGHNEEKAKAAAEEIKSNYVVADVTSNDQLEAAIKQAEQANGPVDILINNAGVWLSEPLATSDPKVIQNVIDVNVLGAIYGARAVLPSMQSRKNGRIINVISQAGLRFSPERTVYHASKWAVTGFTKALQQEVRGDHISVVGFYPGAMNTNFFAKAGDDKDRSKALDPEIAADTLVYICNLPDSVELLEYGVQSLEY